MLFRNAHIKNTVWHGLLHHVQTRAAWHGGCDTHNFWVILRLSQKTFAKHARVTGRVRSSLLLNTGFRIKLRHTMIAIIRHFGRRISLALYCHRVDQNRACCMSFRMAQRLKKRVHIMTINRADIVKT